LDRSPLRRIEERTDVNFVTKWRLAQKYADHIPYPLQNYLRNKNKATGILIVDATFTKVKGEDRAIMIAYDTGIGVIDFWIDYTENKTAYSYIFQRLDKVGYKPICVVSDGHFSITPVITERNLPHQRCIFHLLKNLRFFLTSEGNWKTPKDHILYSRIKGILKTNNIEDLPERIDKFRDFERIFPGRKDIFKWFWSVVNDAVLHLSYKENVPRTTALIENLNGQIKQRIKTFRGVKSEKSLDNLLKILFYFRKYK
jgi:transposase-like protein